MEELISWITTRVVETGIEGNLAKAEKQSLVYAKQEAEELVYNKVIIPRAGEYSLTLSDGTRVWLNSDSEIRYPEAFGKDRRTVFLSGEAYFEVTKDAVRPFYVVLDGMEVKVYGTSFNVNTHYQGKILTTLIEGKVGIRVKSTGAESLLQPNQMAEFSLENKDVKVTDVDTYYYTAWRAGEFVFQNETVEEIMERLCRWYDTEVFYANDSVKGKRFTGVIARFTDVADVLHLIGETATVQFNLKGNTITVSDSRIKPRIVGASRGLITDVVCTSIMFNINQQIYEKNQKVVCFSSFLCSLKMRLLLRRWGLMALMLLGRLSLVSAQNKR